MARFQVVLTDNEYQELAYRATYYEKYQKLQKLFDEQLTASIECSGKASAALVQAVLDRKVTFNG